MHYPSDDMLNALDDTASLSTPSQVEDPPAALTMFMQSMAKLNGSSSMTSLSSMSTGSPRGSPRASKADLFTMGAVFDTYENSIAMNTALKSSDNLSDMKNIDNKLLGDRYDNIGIDMVRKFLLAVERFLDVDGDGTHFLVC